MKTRIISGTCFAIIMLTLLYFGGNILAAGLLLCTLIGEREFYRALGIEKTKYTVMAYIAAAVLFFFLYLDKKLQTGIIIFTFLAMLSYHVCTFPDSDSETLFKAVFGFIYVAVLFAHIYLLRMSKNGFFAIWIAVLCSWGCDTFSYFFGCAFGKHKMSPALSPKKTIEGAVGGVLSCMIIGGLYGRIISEYIDLVPFPLITFGIASGLGALFSIVGDLAASSFKRQYGIKDYGNLIPGHGGILDRFDSLMFTAPAVYYVLLLVEKFI